MHRISLLLIALSCSACTSPGMQAPGDTASHVAFSDDGAATMPPPRAKSLLLAASNSFVSLAGPPKGTPDDAMKTGEFLIKPSGIKDVFENTTQGAVTTLRHRPSGLACIGPQIVFVPKEAIPAFDPGKQSGCLRWESGVQSTLAVIPNGGAVSATQALAALMAHEHTMFPTVEAQKTKSEAPAKGNRASGSMTGTENNAQQYIHFAVTTANGWVVLAETRGDPDQAAECDRVAEAGLGYAVATIHRPGA